MNLLVIYIKRIFIFEFDRVAEPSFFAGFDTYIDTGWERGDGVDIIFPILKFGTIYLVGLLTFTRGDALGCIVDVEMDLAN